MFYTCLIQQNEKVKKRYAGYVSNLSLTGFTLIELLIVIAIIVVFVGAIFVVINPVKRLAESRDYQRRAHLAAIHSAVEQKILMGRGEWVCDEGDIPEEYTTISSEDYDLYKCIYPEYLSDPLHDPTEGMWENKEDYNTKYEIKRNPETERISIFASEGETSLIYLGGDPEEEAFYYDFPGTSLDTDKWITFGEEHGSISVDNGELTISQTASGGSGSNLIGIATKEKFPVGSVYRARVKNISGRHATVIAFGSSINGAYPNYPHGFNVPSVAWYSRADALSSTFSWYDENGNSTTSSGNTGDLTSYQTIELHRVSEDTIELYRNDILEDTISGHLWANDYELYFSLDGHTTPDTIVVDWVEIIP